MVKERMSEDSIPVAVVEDVTLEVPEEPDREDDDHHVEVESNGGSLMNFLTGRFDLFSAIDIFNEKRGETIFRGSCILSCTLVFGWMTLGLTRPGFFAFAGDTEGAT